MLLGLAGMGLGLTGGGAGRLEARLGDQPLGEQLDIAIKILVQQQRLGLGLHGVPL